MKNFIQNSLAIMMIIVATILFGCKKEDEVPVVTTTSVSNIATMSATSGGNIIDEGSSTVITRGVCWSTGTTPTIEDSKTSDGAGAGSFTSNIIDLFGGTTYFVRAYAKNSSGIGYGMALSFKSSGQPPSAPTVTTQNASSIQTSSAQLNGSVNANYYSTVITFEYGLTISYGSTTSATQSPLTGGINTIVSAPLTGLTAGTTYHYRIKAVNSLGTTVGSDLTFTTLGQVPTGTTLAATNITTVSAQLNGTVNANNLTTSVSFEYGTSTSYGTTAIATQSPVTGSSNTSVSAILSGLSPNTTYHFRVITVNSLGVNSGSDLTFTSLGQIPIATTQAASNITTTVATLNGAVNANLISTIVTFEYGTSASYGSTATATQSPVTGNSITNVSANLTELAEGTTYHFRVIAVNSLGTTYGNDLTFITNGQIPTALTQSASNIQLNSVTINGSVNPNYLSTIVSFEFGTTTSYGTTATATPNPVTGTSSTSVSASITGLAEGTNYHYRIKAVNSLGTTYGSDMTFTTLGKVPTVTALTATNITPFAAKLNGTVNANYLESTVTFEYGTTTSYGNTAIATQSPVTGTMSTNVNTSISGLAGGTAYHYRIVASNSLGTTNSNDIAFTTLGQVPTVTTLAATNTTPVAAQLNGTVNANYLESTVTFEYGTTTSYGNTATATQSPVTGTTNTNVSAHIADLIYGTTYHCRIVAINSLGTTFGSDMTFTSAYVIGENINGGLIFYIDGTGLHGLVSAPTDQGDAAWGCDGGTITGADGTAIGTGNQNTIDIINGCTTAGIAAKICYDLDLNGYSDWFLPSKDELNLMYTNLALNGIGGFGTRYYWSSSESPNNNAYCQIFTTGREEIFYKYYPNAVRAVRAF